MRFFAYLALTLGLLMTQAAAADPHPRSMTIDDLLAFKRIADPQISPDGKQVVYQVMEITDVSQNLKHTHLWLAATDGSTPPRQLTSSGKADTHPRWSPDGTKILFESNRGGTSQLYIIDLKHGGEAIKITDISTGAGSAIWSPNGKLIAFVSTVYPEFSQRPFPESDHKNKEKAEAIEKNPVKARTFTKLFYRHWDSYVEDKRQHLFVCEADGKNCRDVTPGDRDAHPTSSTFSSSQDFTFTPDSKHLVFTAVPKIAEAWSTNYELCRVSVDNTSSEWETLTQANPAADSGPQFSPDGRKLAWRAQQRAGYEADKWDILVADCTADGTLAGSPRPMLQQHDLSANEFLWLNDARLLFTAEQQGRGNIYRLDISQANQRLEVMTGGVLGSLSRCADGRHIAYTAASMTAPAEVHVCLSDFKGSTPVNVSSANRSLLAALQLPQPESVTVPVEGGTTMQMWILKPPGFQDQMKWPVVYLIHGGPQGAWEDGWSFRWNPQLWAAQGYVIVMPNPRGSTGFGQQFVDEITGDWGGKCYRDLVAGLQFVKKLPYVDTARLASAGASFGGYMQNWFAVNDIARNFKCLITHCSVWNFESMWGTTDELWFDEWEHGGLPWEYPGKYREFSPHTRAGELGKHRVPMLIIHNDLDFRCPIGQGHELFSALQRQGVSSRFVNFPDEGHWVLKPANSRHWHQEVFDWLKQHAPPGGR